MTLREEVARALDDALIEAALLGGDQASAVADAAIALIVERCAGVADDYDGCDEHCLETSSNIATAIRQLKGEQA